MGHLSQQEAIPGKQIQLTIDYDLQQVAETGLGDKKGAVIALDPRTGEVLAFASHPAPDPNDFAIRVSKEEWQRLNEDPGKPLLNRVTQAQLAPGSVFKIIMATAMLESKTPSENFTAFCPGYGVFYGQMHKCWVYGKKSHGVVNLHTAIVQSATCFSTISASAWGSTQLPNTPRCWAWEQGRGSTCRRKNPAWCHRKNGYSACITTSGIRARRFRFPSGRVR
jgi:penicillin-binding protein 2